MLKQMLKPFATPVFNIVQHVFHSVQQNRTDVEANVEAVCPGLDMHAYMRVALAPRAKNANHIQSKAVVC